LIYWFPWTDYSVLRASPFGHHGGRSPPLRGVVEPSFCLSAVRIWAEQSGNAVGLTGIFLEIGFPGRNRNQRENIENFRAF
jgi:hypothetical protein